MTREPRHPHVLKGEPQPGLAELVARLRDGDPVAFDHVYETYRARVYSFLLRLTRDPARARDLSQDTWLRLAVNAHRLAPDSDPGAWLFTVARNLFLSEQRFRFLRRARLRELALFATRTTPPALLEHTDAEARLERALAQLPIAQREVLLLITVEGFTADEVAAMLDLDPAAVRKRLSRGRAALKQALER